MFEEAFEKLNLTEQEAFRRIVNWLLAHTYLLQGNYAFEDNMKRTNPDYQIGRASCGKECRSRWSPYH